ncbi:MAG: hypothetical protein ACRDDZ_05875 [Marinifilaceae bacterium]
MEQTAKKTTAKESKESVHEHVVEVKSIIEEVATTNWEDKYNTVKEQYDRMAECIARPKLPNLVVIPYKKAEKQGDELLVTIHGWLRYFQDPMVILVVGDKEDYFEEMGIIHLESECQTDNPPLDIVKKLSMVTAMYPDYDEIIVTNDDIYPVNPFGVDEIRLLKCTGMLHEKINAGSLYQRNKERTLALLSANNLPTYNYDTHLPMVYDTEKLMALFRKHDMNNEAYLLSSLYFNTYFPDRIPFKLDIRTDNFKCGVYRLNPDYGFIRECLKTKIWFNHSQQAYTPELLNLIKKQVIKND